jgi:hypothetical protein
MTSRHRPTPETKDGGRQTGSTCISRYTLYRNKIRNIICMFSMSARPMNTMLTAADIERHRKRKIPTVPVWRPPSFVSGVGRCRRVSNLVYRCVRRRKHRNNISNSASIYYRTRDTSTSGLVAAILFFRFTSKPDYGR